MSIVFVLNDHEHPLPLSAHEIVIQQAPASHDQLSLSLLSHQLMAGLLDFVLTVPQWSHLSRDTT